MTETFRADPADAGAGVRWRSWGPAAFDEAARTDRPMLLSLTTVWCPSCRRMKETTYADPEIVRLINDEFVPVQVDADWYPHVQDRYIAGGWPTNAFLTTTGEVLWAGTYVAPEQFRAVAAGALSAWRERREDLRTEIERRRKAMEAARSRHAAVGLVRREAADDVLLAVQDAFDARNGGFGSDLKFPHAEAIEMLFILGRRAGNPDWLAMAERSLDGMLAGELRDAREGGFFRYATREDWTRPRREKLLDANAALLRVYALGAKVANRPDWREAAVSTVKWVERALRREDGLYAGSQAADEDPWDEGGARHGVSGSAQRIDPVVYTSWNAHWIRALADAGGWLGRPEWIERAAAALDRLLGAMHAPDDLLYHFRTPGGAPSLPGLLVDLVEVGAACLAVAQATGRAGYLRRAERLAQVMERTLWTADGGFLDHRPGPEDVGAVRYPARPFELNAAAARLLLDLAIATGERGHRAAAERTLALLSPLAGRYGIGGATFAVAVEEFFEPPLQVVIVGADDVAAALRRAALALPEPGARVWTLERGGRIGQGEFQLQNGGAAYVCGARFSPRPVRAAEDLTALAVAAR